MAALLQSLERDKDGYLLDRSNWSKPVATALAEEHGLSLEDEHWEIIFLLRAFYQEYNLSPAMRPLIKYIKLHLGEDKAKSLYLLSLFPDSPAKLAAKLAGLPRPANCL